MLTLALTGGIGSGKSTAARIWGELGAHVIDADQVARDVVEPGTPALAKIARRWPRVVDAEGRLDRSALAEIVFSDPNEREALNAITHPAIADEVERRITQLNLSDPSGVVVYDVPLLVGQPGEFAMTANVCVNVAEDERVRRLVTERGMSEDEAWARIAAQATDEQRAAISDVVLTNDAGESDFRDVLTQVWHTWVIPFAQRMNTGEYASGALPTGALFNEEVDLQVRRLEARGLTVSVDPVELVVDGPPDQLPAAGWVNAGEHWRHANPALNLRARLR
ncbi:dephospho-CoA kinase [Trueperella bialowiezensis]|uniref:Dephospho-CoA kinase n=1 Tax=Trueperella bialowiezensis TaxID=312285 RepID=A0A448PBW5_9ACTO|nr:dephospho-CoA kinase [Trueperella bialowiezensis]VEI12396.1 Dephospho-CoA kinase [Trueperella bialowiezensis]